MVTLKYFAAALGNMWLNKQKGTDEGCSRARLRHLLSLGLSPKLKRGEGHLENFISVQNNMQTSGFRPQRCSDSAPPSEKCAYLG